MKSSTFAWLVLVIIVVAGLAWWYVAKAPAATPTNQAPAATVTNAAPQSDQGMQDNGVSAGVSATVGAPVTITYDGTSFSPASVTVPVGATVKWVDTAGQMWVASNPHPVHSGYDGTDRATHCAAGYTGAAPFDQCAAGGSYTFTFTKAGSWGYHDHFNHTAGGTVVVQ